MNYAEIKKISDRIFPQIKDLHPWHGFMVSIDETGEPYAILVIQTTWWERLLYKLRLKRIPNIPNRIDGIPIQIQVASIAHLC